MKIIENFVRTVLLENDFDQVAIGRLVGKKIQVQNAEQVRSDNIGGTFVIQKLENNYDVKSKFGKSKYPAIMVFISKTRHFLASPKELEMLAKNKKATFSEFLGSGNDIWVTLI